MKVVVKDFLSYDSAEVDLHGSTIAVVGENGAGKSALLEAFPYAYYGLGRESLAGMSRIKGDGSHEVQVWEGDTVVKRGRKENGKGYVEVRVSNELIAKGKEAEDWIAEYLGMDVDTYMLVAFFGLHDVRHDVLIRVLPSARLETMQKLAKIGPYRYFGDKAKEGYEKASRTMESLEAQKVGAEAVLTEDSVIQEGISAGHSALAEFSEQLKTLKERRKKLLIEEEKYQAFVKERERLGVERKGLRGDIASMDTEEASLKKEASEDAQSVEDDLAAKKKLIKSLADIDVEALKKSLLRNEGVVEKKAALLELKESAVVMGAVEASCPLCGGDVDEKMFSRWKTEVDELRALLAKARTSISTSKKRIEEARKLERDIESLDQDIKTVTATTAKGAERLKEIERERRKLSSELEKKESRFVDLTEKLGDDYQTLQADIEEVGENISQVTGRIGETNGSLKQLNETLKKNEEYRKMIAFVEKDAAKAREDMGAYKLLREAWSRYGIPMRLIQDLAREIEQRASAVYQEFDNGVIEVREVEDRGKPGMEFYLIDRKGERTFNQLSAGEKVMFFVAIRVAVAQYVAERTNVRVNYLILDEAMGNLSSKRRDDLVRVINKVLRKLFQQVIMVSHTEMRDIFSQTVRVKAENEVSKVEVA